MKNLKTYLLIIGLTTSTGTVFSQQLSDPMFKNMTRVEMGDHFMKKNDELKGAGYIFMGAGIAMQTAAYFMYKEDENNPNVDALILAGTVSIGISYPLFTAGSKANGRAEMLYMNPDPAKAAELTKQYQQKARTNSIIAWSLLGTGILTPLILRTSADEYEGMSNTAETISLITSLGVFVSIPFFMEAAKNKGRISILTRTEHLPTSFIQGSGTHRSIGIGFPIGH